MPEALGEGRWAAIRAACEGALPTHAHVAAVAGICIKTLTRKANAQGWATLDLRRPRVRAAHRQMIALAAAAASGEELDRADNATEEMDALAELGAMREEALAPLPPLPDLPQAARAARLRAMIAGRIEELVRRAEAGRPIESRQVASLTALAQLADRIGDLDPEPEALERQRLNDDELAACLDRINNRIVEHAAHLAARILVNGGMSEREAEAAVAAHMPGAAQGAGASGHAGDAGAPQQK